MIVLLASSTDAEYLPIVEVAWRIMSSARIARGFHRLETRAACLFSWGRPLVPFFTEDDESPEYWRDGSI